jgi:hypothetical protein
MARRPGSLALAAIAIGLAAAPAVAAPTAVPLDTETTVSGVPVACTGVGEAKLNPHWNSYPVRVEFSGADNQLAARGALTVFDEHGAEVVSVACEGPWILLKLPAGSYRIEGRLPGTEAAPQRGYFRVTPDGPTHLELRFPDA